MQEMEPGSMEGASGVLFYSAMYHCRYNFCYLERMMNNCLFRNLDKIVFEINFAKERK